MGGRSSVSEVLRLLIEKPEWVFAGITKAIRVLRVVDLDLAQGHGQLKKEKWFYSFKLHLFKNVLL